MQFQRESTAILDEAMSLFEEHFKEISANQDIALEPDRQGYKNAEANNALRVFTAREDDGKLIGYAVFFVKNNLHYKSSLQANQDIIFITKNRRGSGGRFIQWCDRQLKEEGVQVVYHHIKKDHNFGPMLERFGYKLVDLIYQRRLDLWEPQR